MVVGVVSSLEESLDGSTVACKEGKICMFLKCIVCCRLLDNDDTFDVGKPTFLMMTIGQNANETLINKKAMKNNAIDERLFQFINRLVIMARSLL